MARAPITRARSITTTPTMSMSMRAKARGVFTAVMKSKPSAQFDYALGAGADLGGGFGG